MNPAAGATPVSTFLSRVFVQPSVQRRAVAPDLGHSVARLRGGDPRLDRPPLPVDEVFVPEKVAARVVLRVGLRHALELLPVDFVALLAERGDERDDLLP